MELVSEMFPVVIDPASYGFSPSQLLGLSTPPASQRATPAASFNEFSASLQQSTGGKWLLGVLCVCVCVYRHDFSASLQQSTGGKWLLGFCVCVCTVMTSQPVYSSPLEVSGFFVVVVCVCMCVPSGDWIY